MGVGILSFVRPKQKQGEGFAVGVILFDIGWEEGSSHHKSRPCRDALHTIIVP